MYRLSFLDSNTVQRLSDGAWIPMEETNRDYRKYLRWVAEGNTPEPAPSPPSTSKSTSERALDLLLKLAEPTEQADIDEKAALLADGK